MRAMLSGLTGVSSDTIYLYLEDAKAKIIAFGIGITHDRFDELQRYLTSHLMSAANIGGGGKISSESVADVSIQYEGGAGSLKTLYATNWEREYHKVLNQINGLMDRCL